MKEEVIEDNMEKRIRGIIPPIVTPFDEDGFLNDKLAEKEMQICVESGVHGLSVGGSTGEGPTLRDEELVELINIAKGVLKEDQSLICGVMRTCTRDAVRRPCEAVPRGAGAPS